MASAAGLAASMSRAPVLPARRQGKHMNILSKIAVIAALAMTAQPCLAAAASAAPSGAAQVQFDLQNHVSSAAIPSMTLAASQQTASEIQDPPKRKGPGTTTLLIVGGVLLLVLVAAAVASAAPTPGPSEGAFD